MFKFYNIPDLRTLESIIGDKPTLKFSSAFNLNDPFELKFNLLLDPFAKGQEEAFSKAHPGSTPEDFMKWQEQIANNDEFTWYVEQEQRKNLSLMITLCSLTEKNNNNLMWSHYTGNYRGVCVEYSNTLLDYLRRVKGFLACGKVRYTDFPPMVDSLEEKELKIDKMVFNKQFEWKYEQEHRVVLLSDNDTDFIPIEPNYIKAVYIGSRADNGILNKTIEICKRNNFGCYYTISLGKTYEVQFERHKEGTFYMKSLWS